MQDIRKLIKYLFQYRRLVSFSILCHILMAIFTIVSIPLVIPFFQILFNTDTSGITKPEGTFNLVNWLKYFFVTIINDHGTSKALFIVCIMIIVTFLFKNLFRYLAMFFMVPVRSSIVRDLRSGLYQNYINGSLERLKHSQRGDLISRIISDVQEVEWSILRFIDAIFKSPIIIIGSIVFMLSINVQLTLFVFILMIFTIVVIGTLSKTLKKQSATLQENLGMMTSTVDETLDGSTLIKVFRSKSYWVEKFDTLNQSFRKTMNKVIWRQDLSSPLSEFLGVSLVVILLWVGSHMVLDDALASEDFFAFIFAFYNVIEPSKSFATAYYNVRKGSAALERINTSSIKEQKQLLPDERNPFLFNKTLEIKDVHFSYDDQKILEGINFTVNKSEKVALVGPSGAGKSTMILLILRLLEPDRGQILLDGVDIRTIPINNYYKEIGLVSQSSFLFNDTIKENIIMGRESIDDNMIKSSLELANAFDFVSQLENQIGFRIGDRGELLSGGERQRLTIARALLEDPELLIFDEPTSALDPESESKVSQAMLNALKDRTAIIIAHRLSTIKYADRILVLNKGRIEEEGSHMELMSNNGLYSDYVSIQSFV